MNEIQEDEQFSDDPVVQERISTIIRKIRECNPENLADDPDQDLASEFIYYRQIPGAMPAIVMPDGPRILVTDSMPLDLVIPVGTRSSAIHIAGSPEVSKHPVVLRAQINDLTNDALSRLIDLQPAAPVRLSEMLKIKIEELVELYPERTLASKLVDNIPGLVHRPANGYQVEFDEVDQLMQERNLPIDDELDELDEVDQNDRGGLRRGR